MEPPSPPAPRLDLLDVPTAAAYLRIPPSALYKLSAARKITTYRVGARLRFDRADLDAFARRVEAVSS